MPITLSQLRTLFLTGSLITTTSLSANSQNHQSLSDQKNKSVHIDFEFNYQKVTPRIVNGRQVYESKLEPCIKSVKIRFPRPQSLNSLLGQVVLLGPLNMKRALVIESMNSDWRTLELKTDQSMVCRRSGLNKLIVKKGIVGLDGHRSQQDLVEPIPFPPERELNDANSSYHAVDSSDELKNLEIRQTSFTHDELGRLELTSARKSISWGRVTGAQVNKAVADLERWMAFEKVKPIYRNTGSGKLSLLPLDELLNQYAEVNRKHHYGNPDTIYVLRRAAKFTKMLFSDLDFVPIADLSRPDGKTPYVDFGSERIHLHPEGSHQNGRDVDVSYITTGGGNDPKAPIDFERNFWFLYGILQSTGVDLVMTAYRDEFLTMANQAYQKGLINSYALGRFEMLMQDDGLNHDKHFHISVSNDINMGKSRKFTKSDDVYSCYLGLRPNFRGGNYNYCSSL